MGTLEYVQKVMVTSLLQQDSSILPHLGNAMAHSRRIFQRRTDDISSSFVRMPFIKMHCLMSASQHSHSSQAQVSDAFHPKLYILSRSLPLNLTCYSTSPFLKSLLNCLNENNKEKKIFDLDACHSKECVYILHYVPF